MKKILHVSDLHFCADKGLLTNLESFSNEIRRKFPKEINLDIHAADESVLEKLHEFVNEQDPDLVVITGDITTFGDKRSFDRASEWIGSLVQRSGRKQRKWLVVPGNHDVLQNLLSVLVFDKIEGLGWPKKVALSKYLKCIEPLRTHLIKSSRVEHFLDNFHAFVNSREAVISNPYAMDLDEHSESKCAVFPFSTISSDPIWMNIGNVRKKEWDALNHSLMDDSYNSRGTLRIALTHHNPISSPDMIETEYVNAFNSMPGGTDFLKTLQGKGIDLLLHGHQHTRAAYCFDFQLNHTGHAYAVGCPSSSSKDGGCNIIEIQDVNNIQLNAYDYTEKDGFTACTTDFPLHLPLERHSPVDTKTKAARFELKRYWYGGAHDEETDIWASLQRPGASYIYMSGRHLANIRERAHSLLDGLISDQEQNTKIRILVSDPEMIRAISTATDNLNGSNAADFWGAKEALGTLASEAENTIGALLDYIKNKSAKERERIDLRVSHTFLPFGAFVRNADKPWGKMGVQILPIGMIGSLDTPVLSLNRRQDAAMYDYYLKYLKYLFLKGKSKTPEWCFGEGDLMEGINANLLGR